MKSIIYVGIDVHKNNYTLSSYTFENDKNFATATVEASTKNVLKYLERVGKDKEAEFQVGYEAGCCGFVLYEELKKFGVDCVVMAPSTMPNRKNEIKTDKRDAMKIARRPQTRTEKNQARNSGILSAARIYFHGRQKLLDKKTYGVA